MDVRLIGYARCSTRAQNPDRQIIALWEFGVLEEDIVVEMLSGKNFQRPAYHKLVSQLKPGDAMVIDSLDRLGRDRDAVVDEWRRITKEQVRISLFSTCSRYWTHDKKTVTSRLHS